MLSQQMKDAINNSIMKKFGMSYDEFEKLDFYEQQRLIIEYHKHNKKKISGRHTMIGEGEDSIMLYVKNGERIQIGTGEDSCFVISGVTPEEERRRLDKDFGKVCDGGKSFVKKIFRGRNKC